MPKYLNPQPYDLHLAGPNGEKIKIRRNQTVRLSSFFERYARKGILKRVDRVDNDVLPKSNNSPVIATTQKRAPIRRVRRLEAIKTARKRVITDRTKSAAKGNNSKKLGHGTFRGATEDFLRVLRTESFPISNGIAVGILSYNRVDSLRRLVNSIQQYTNLAQTTVFISDDHSDCDVLYKYLGHLQTTNKFVILRNDERLGVAGNSNRLLRCMKRFPNKIILNDDVEVICKGWDSFYFDAMHKSRMHHFCYRQPGVYGAQNGERINQLGAWLNVVHDKPHGAVMAFDHVAFDTVGYFDEKFGYYGVEHVDWSSRVAKSEIQLSGFYDVDGSDKYFVLHKEKSAVPNRIDNFRKAKSTYKNMGHRPIRVEASDRSAVPSINYVIPFRDGNRRHESILTLINNIRAQRYPDINIVLAEHDSQARLSDTEIAPLQHVLVKENTQFNKSKAFNAGVAMTSGSVVLHDADTMVPGSYTQQVVMALNGYESCHICARVYYVVKESTEDINNEGLVSDGVICEKFVDYFEGGSLACTVDSYWRVGGFVEEYVGYGCFVPGHFVSTERGLVLIEDVVKSDRLLTHTGVYKHQEQRVRCYDGEVFNIYVPGRLPIKGVTPEHPFLVHDRDGEYVWRKACDLEVGDLLAQSDIMPDLSPSVSYRDISESDGSKNQFDVDDNMDDVCYLLGLYLAEGVIQSPQRLKTTYFFLDEFEEFLARHVEDVVNRLNPNISVNYDYVKDRCRHVVVCNSYLAKIIYSICGKHKSTSKIISTDFLRELSPNNLGHLIGGMVDGDAGHQFNSEKRLVYHTSSLNLAFLASSILRSIGAAHSFGKRKGGGFKNSKKWSYDLTINREFEALVNSIYPKPEYVGSNSVGKSQFGLIYDIRSQHYVGPVYNFEVEDDRSYYVHGICVHNCEDCDFYARISRATKWIENRVVPMAHLYHGRADGWREHHNTNRELEGLLNKMTIAERISAQRSKMAEGPYTRFIR